MKKIKEFIGTETFLIAEWLKIDLGWLGPIMFGWMMGCKGKRIK